jgi:adenine-specific DNA-methyltransferase
MPAKLERREVKQYTYEDQKRLNNPPVGLVTAETDHLNGKKTYQFDPHLDPQLQWAGKTEGTSFAVDTVSLHVHERIDPLTIIKAVRSRAQQEQSSLFGYFENKENNPPIREAIEFYKHSQGWSNRMVAGDSLLVMNSLLEKEGMAGKVQMMYVDPPYGIKYGSNFQPFVNKRQVKDGVDEDLTQEPETVKAFRDTWELGIHSYLTYLRERLLLARNLLNESGSIFVQIGDENVHLVRALLDEVFSSQNFCGLIPFVKTTGQTSKLIAPVCDYLLWYAKDRSEVKYRPLYLQRGFDRESLSSGNYRWVELPDGKRRPLTAKELDNPESIPLGGKVFALSGTSSQTRGKETPPPFSYKGNEFRPEGSRGWSTSQEGLNRLAAANRLYPLAKTLRYVRYYDDFPLQPLRGLWTDTGISGFASDKVYVVQTNTKVVERCVLMTTDPGDLVFDPTCGSGTSAFCAEKWGRRWITCDTSRVAITIAKQRLMTAVFEYYEFSNPNEGVSGGFNYRRVQHVTLRSMANNEPPQHETLYDQPVIDQSRRRVTGPFTLEAVPSQRVRGLEDTQAGGTEADSSIARSGETLRQNEWVDELLSAGIRGKNGQILKFVRVELISGTQWLNARAETDSGKGAVVSFGPEYSPLEQRQVELAIGEAQELVPKPKLVIFASFQFDPEASKDIDELKWPGVDVLKVQMNTDLLTSDLKKKTASNESFWLVGQPDVEIRRAKTGYEVVVNGFDYYNTRSGELESGDASKIAVWELDTDYDGRSLYPRQVFFPLSDNEGGWTKLARNLRGLIDENLIESYRGNQSLPFKPGDNGQIAVKIIDDRGIESLKIIRVGHDLHN